MGQETTGVIVAMLARLDERVAELRDLLVGQRAVKDLYTTAEVAAALGKAEYTVREWCRYGRVRAQKRACGRGRSREWVITHEELARIRNEGLLPPSGQ
jgi:hypothetical protein